MPCSLCRESTSLEIRSTSISRRCSQSSRRSCIRSRTSFWVLAASRNTSCILCSNSSMLRGSSVRISLCFASLAALCRDKSSRSMLAKASFAAVTECRPLPCFSSCSFASLAMSCFKPASTSSNAVRYFNAFSWCFASCWTATEPNSSLKATPSCSTWDETWARCFSCLESWLRMSAFSSSVSLLSNDSRRPIHRWCVSLCFCSLSWYRRSTSSFTLDSTPSWAPSSVWYCFSSLASWSLCILTISTESFVPRASRY
mmetsp:Transcript_48822/g.129399  ORF Transcript_48822/g.129399 Transcript_48822/m.129399 type:complete len:257 (+) Transcript_48822:1421-2191(+)